MRKAMKSIRKTAVAVPDKNATSATTSTKEAIRTILPSWEPSEATIRRGEPQANISVKCRREIKVESPLVKEQRKTSADSGDGNHGAWTRAVTSHSALGKWSFW
jgi:hypothetical protein